MSQLFLSRARLSAGLERLAPLLFPDDPALRLSASHRLVWTLFPEDLRERPFLYRETAPSHAAGPDARSELMVLSAQPPHDALGLFQVETKPFAPTLRRGEHLRFSLRANPVVSRNVTGSDGKTKAVRRDVVMEALHSVARGKERIEARPQKIQEAGFDWLRRQGEAAGFLLPDREGLKIDGYEQFAIDADQRRGARGGGGVHSRLDFDGLLEIVEPDVFLEKLAVGFGRARAFGYGLMLIRRA